MKISIILLAYNEEKNINDEINKVKEVILDKSSTKLATKYILL